MSTGELLGIEPLELKFPFELKKQISCSLQLANKTDNFIAFKVKTTNPKKYCVRPNTGIVMPRSTCDVIVTMQAQKEAPLDMQCRDKFLLQSVKAHDGVTVKDITAEMFNKESGNVVEECKLRVVYVSPPQPPSPVPEGSEEGSSPRGSVSDNGNGNGNGFDFVPAPRVLPEPQDISAELKDLISKLTEEKNSAIHRNNKLRQELEHLRLEGSKSRGGVSFILVIFIGLLGIIMGSAPLFSSYSRKTKKASLILLRRAPASTLFSKLLNPVCSVSVSPSVSRSFAIRAGVTASDDVDRAVDVASHSDLYPSGRRDSFPSLFSDVFDPFSPTRSLSRVLNLMDQFMENPFLSSRGMGARRGWDVKEDNNALNLRMDMPGLSREDVNVSVDQNTLMIKGECSKETDNEESGRRYSSMLELPPNIYKVDEIKAEMKNGVLKVVVPKVTEEERKDVYEVKVE
ncbi:hypothetical protein SLE2022_226780 [Rubroshorea leprosula]